MYPDVVLQSLERGHRLQAVVEVETGESVNHLEALAEWAHFARLRVPFHLYVPAGMVDVARRLCEDNHISVAEIWSFHTIGDQVRFTLVHRNRDALSPARAKRPSAPPARSGNGAPRKAGPRSARKAAPARARKVKTARKAARSTKRK